jgi:hypothetical protein
VKIYRQQEQPKYIMMYKGQLMRFVGESITPVVRVTVRLPGYIEAEHFDGLEMFSFAEEEFNGAVTWDRAVEEMRVKAHAAEYHEIKKMIREEFPAKAREFDAEEEQWRNGLRWEDLRGS